MHVELLQARLTSAERTIEKLNVKAELGTQRKQILGISDRTLKRF